MKKLILTFSLMLSFWAASFAQRFVYVDVTTILESVPEYAEAQKALDQQAEQWKQEIAREYSKIDEMYRKYQAEEVLLNEATRKTRQDDIVNKEKQVREMQKKRFGTEGDLAIKRKSLVQPIQEKVYSIIQKYATEKSYDFILDKSSMTGMLFASPQYDKTSDIIQRLGSK